jgi:hypothetical protein
VSTATPNYAATTTHTITLASLASDTNLVAGREGTAIDNSSEDAIDAILGGKITTGTTPTTARQIEIWISGSYDGTTYAGGATGSDANLTPSEKTLMRLGCVIPTVATSDKAYQFIIGSVAAMFGGVLPKKYSVFVVHNTGVNLNSTGGNHEIKHTPVKFEST